MVRSHLLLRLLIALICWAHAAAFRTTSGILKRMAAPARGPPSGTLMRRTWRNLPVMFHSGALLLQPQYMLSAHVRRGALVERYAKRTDRVDANFTLPTVAKVVATSLTMLQSENMENNTTNYPIESIGMNCSAQHDRWYNGITDLIGIMASYFPDAAKTTGQIPESTIVHALNGSVVAEEESRNKSTLSWVPRIGLYLQETVRRLNPVQEGNCSAQQSSPLRLETAVPFVEVTDDKGLSAPAVENQSVADMLWAAVGRIRSSAMTSGDRAAANRTHERHYQDVDTQATANITHPTGPRRSVNASVIGVTAPTTPANTTINNWLSNQLSTAGSLAVSTVLSYLPRGGSKQDLDQNTTSSMKGISDAAPIGAADCNKTMHAPIADETEDSTPPTLLRRIYNMLPGWTRTNDTRVDAVAQIIEQIDANISANSSQVAVIGPDLAIQTALAVNSTLSAQTFLTQIGLNATMAPLLQGDRSSAQISHIEALRALSLIVRYHPDSAVEVANQTDVVTAVCEILEQPQRAIETWLPLRSVEDRKRILTAQHEAVALVHRLVRSSDQAAEALQQHARLRRALLGIVEAERATSTKELADAVRSTWATKAVLELQQVKQGQADSRKDMKTYRVRKQSNVTAVGEYEGLRTAQMVRVAAWSLGGVPWRPRVPGQKGLRILSLDGGGTRGVLSIAFLKEIFRRANCPFKPHQMFDMICGTSTGGIIAALLGAERANLEEAEVLYDEFIDKIFTQRSNLRLVTEQAAYDGRDWEKILYDMCGDQLFVDSNQHDCARVFCISTMVNVNPPVPHLWRNYNYPPGVSARYPGASRANTFTAIRATTAAPTFFTPVHWGKGLYCDGALVANNPTAIAMQEAKLLYPNVPVELVVSIGTGYTTTHSTLQSMGWDVLVNQLVASSTDTEDVHALLRDFLPPDKYFRFNPVLPDAVRIDEKDRTALSRLKEVAQKHISEVENGPEKAHFAKLLKLLRGK